MGTVPAGNMAGLNQTNPAMTATPRAFTPTATGIPSAPTPNPIAGGAVPSSTNPYLFGGGVPGASPQIPPAAPGTTFSPNVPTGSQPLSTDQLNALDLSRQWGDIAGSTGYNMAAFYQGLGGTESDIYKNWLQSMQPQYATAAANLGQGLGAAGVSPNSTVAGQAEANLQAQELAQQGGVEAQLMQQNQQDQLKLLTGMEQPAEQQVAQSSGWNLFSNILGGIGSVASLFPGVGTAIGAGLKGIGGLFGKAGGSTVPSGGGGGFDSTLGDT